MALSKIQNRKLKTIAMRLTLTEKEMLTIAKIRKTNIVFSKKAKDLDCFISVLYPLTLVKVRPQVRLPPLQSESKKGIQLQHLENSIAQGLL